MEEVQMFGIIHNLDYSKNEWAGLWGEQWGVKEELHDEIEPEL